MTFELALVKLKEGNYLTRRVAWINRFIFVLSNHGKPIIHMASHDLIEGRASITWEPTQLDILADDWEIV